MLVAHGDETGDDLLREARSTIDRCPDPGIVGRYLDRVESRHGRAAPAPSVTELIEDLTDREIGVLWYLPSELSQREIASELFVSLNTVKTHCKAIYRKLGVPGRKAAVQTARDLGLLRPPVVAGTTVHPGETRGRARRAHPRSFDARVENDTPRRTEFP